MSLAQLAGLVVSNFNTFLKKIIMLPLQHVFPLNLNQYVDGKEVPHEANEGWADWTSICLYFCTLVIL